MSSPWLLNGKEFDYTEVADWATGFVYLITNKTNNKKYIGKKIFQFTNRVKKKGRKNRVVIKRKSDWETYWGSADTLLEDVKKLGESNFKREILSIHESKADLSYYEMKYQVDNDVLNSDEYYNSNILTKFFRKKPTRSLFSASV